MGGPPVPDSLNDVSGRIIGAAIEVHRQLGPGLLESAYDACLGYELARRHLSFEHQKALPLIYCGIDMGCGYRVDFLVEQAVVVEIKAIERFEPVHVAQVLSYLRLSGCKLGLLFNFNVKWLVDQGLKRVVSGFPG